jgi:hypothetical protein
MVFESLLSYSRLREHTVSSARGRSQANYLASAIDVRPGEVYHEDAFRHFLTVERTRARRSSRPFLLLLVSLRRCPSEGIELPRSAWPALWDGLTESVREVDFVGWYREGRVAAAVLTQGLGLQSDAPDRIAGRVTKILGAHLPQSLVSRLRVRVIRLEPKENA